MDIGFVFTNFNNSPLTREAIKSLLESTASNSCSIVIVDNNSDSTDVALLKEMEQEFSRVKFIFNQENIGYFSGLNVGVNYLRGTGREFDCIVIGNNDLVFPDNFLTQLNSCRHRMHQYAVISPDLITLDGVHQNPHVRDRTTAFREFAWDVYYSNYYFALIIGWLAKVTRGVTERKDYTSYKKEGVIFQGYGACYILTPVFFQYFEELWAPTFLMGEEFFLWKQLSTKEQEIFYEPNISVSHHDHATTANVPSKMRWKMSREAYLIYKKYK